MYLNLHFALPSIATKTFFITFLIVLSFLAFLPDTQAQTLNLASSSAEKNSSKITTLICKPDLGTYETKGNGEWDKFDTADCTKGLKDEHFLAGIQCLTQRYVITPNEGWQISELYFGLSTNLLPPQPGYSSVSLLVSINRATGDYTRTINKTSSSNGSLIIEKSYGKCTMKVVQRKF